MLGRYNDDDFRFPNGRIAANLAITVCERGLLVPVTLYSDLAGLHEMANPTRTDQYGNLTFVAELGDYDFYPEFGGRIEAEIGNSGAPGPPGPAGPQGPPGEPDALSYTVNIGSASSVWEGDHPLGFIPAGISVQDQSGAFRFGFVVVEMTNSHYKIDVGAPKIGHLTLS